jgi:hypothetical protein
VLAASFAAAAEALVEVLAAVCAEEPEPGAKIGAAVEAALSFAAAEPALAALLGLEAAVAVPNVRSSRDGLSEELGEALGSVRGAMPAGVGALLVAAALALLSDRRGEGGSAALAVLGADLAALLA